MFSLLKQFFENLNIDFKFLNRTNSPSTKQVNELGDNIGGDKHVYNHPEPKIEYAEVVYSWTISEQHQENDKIIAYEFSLTLLNKSDLIIRDFWVNFSSSGFNLEVERTPHTEYFEGSNFHGMALNLIAKHDYRYAPQNLLTPFKIRIILKKEFIPDHEAWLYFSFGSPNVKKVEKEGRVSANELKSFVGSSDHDTTSFLKLLGLSNSRS